MADPFTGAMGATHVRVGFEGDALSVREVAVSASARFNLDLRPTDPRVIARMRVDVLRNGAVIAQGATPPVAWLNVGGQRLTAFVQASDSVALAPGGAMRTPRADFTLVSAGGRGAVAFTLPPGAADAAPDWYFLPAHRQQPYSRAVSAAFDGEATVVPLPSDRGVLLIRGERALVTNDASDGAPPMNPIPPERRLLRAASVASDTDAAFLLGGRGDAIERSARIDQVSEVGEVTAVSYALATPRVRPGLLRLAPRTTTAAPVYLVYGGQDPACDACRALERWSPGAAGTPVSVPVTTAGASLDRRVDFAAVCVALNAAQQCDRVLILGGVDATTGALATRDLVLDAECLRAGGASCVRFELEALSVRRRGLRAAVGEDGRRVVVVGGRDASGQPVYAVDVLDATDPATITRVAGERTLPVADPAILAMADGSVMIAGGIDRETTRPSGSVWFVRGALAPLGPPGR